ncbi:hypothetical protein J6590_104940 [Homalodisca vitripennis]|nr:hypothetical protein J6590_104940 [Homalodisca vitripennis]
MLSHSPSPPPMTGVPHHPARPSPTGCRNCYHRKSKAPGTIRAVSVERRAALERHQSGEGGHDTSGASVLQYTFE